METMIKVPGKPRHTSQNTNAMLFAQWNQTPVYVQKRGVIRIVSLQRIEGDGVGDRLNQTSLRRSCDDIVRSTKHDA